MRKFAKFLAVPAAAAFMLAGCETESNDVHDPGVEDGTYDDGTDDTLDDGTGTDDTLEDDTEEDF